MTSERIRIGDQYYLLASALAPRQRRELLNHADSFAIFDPGGDIPLAGLEAYGLFHNDTRFLSRFELKLNNTFPILLSSAPSADGSELLTYLSNPDEHRNGELVLERDTLAIERGKTLHDDALYERLRLHNYGAQPLRVELAFTFEADFADIFEIRGLKRARHGALAEPVIGMNCVRLGYRGLDDVPRETVVTFEPVPQSLAANSAHFQLDLAPNAESVIEVHVQCRVNDRTSSWQTYATAVQAVRGERGAWSGQFPGLYSNNEGFNDWLNRSLSDLAVLRTNGAQGGYVYAGIPWFATIFGRDGLITALETLVFTPALATGTLRTLAALQGQARNQERDEEPGKILHELRRGEMAAVGEIPFGRYYGSVDATPLFLILLAEYVDRTADLALARELWPVALAAMQWIDTSGDADGDGYVEYARRGPRGLVNQGWKDSHDAISHDDGTLAEQPIALAEVQGYVYAARRGMARLARRLDQPDAAATWEEQAVRLRERFNRDFWMPTEDAFALALDGQKRACRVVSSNAGHCLFSGIAEPEGAGRLVRRLLSDDLFCGWGIRTLSARERRYNPMSYHNGSVWPHDNALIAAGLARYGATEAAGEVLTALFDAALSLDDRRMPELFCGFPRAVQHSPVPYPVACKPQAWAAGSVFLLLQAALGMSIDAWERRVLFDRPRPPRWLERLEIRGLQVRDAHVDLSITRGRWGTAAIEVMDKHGDIEVVARK